MNVRKSLAVLAATGVTSIALISTAPVASAASEATAMGNAPRCVAVWQHSGRWTKTGHARNDCGYRMNLKIVWANGGDGRCWSVGPGQEITSQVAKAPRRFDGASRC